MSSGLPKNFCTSLAVPPRALCDDRSWYGAVSVDSRISLSLSIGHSPNISSTNPTTAWLSAGAWFSGTHSATSGTHCRDFTESLAVLAADAVSDPATKPEPGGGLGWTKVTGANTGFLSNDTATPALSARLRMNLAVQDSQFEIVNSSNRLVN